MDPVRTRILRVTAASVALGLVVAGCGKNDESSSSSSSSSSKETTSTTTSAAASTSAEASAPSATSDYEALLVKAADIPQPLVEAQRELLKIKRYIREHSI